MKRFSKLNLFLVERERKPLLVSMKLKIKHTSPLGIKKKKLMAKQELGKFPLGIRTMKLVTGGWG